MNSYEIVVSERGWFLFKTAPEVDLKRVEDSLAALRQRFPEDQYTVTLCKTTTTSVITQDV